MDKFSKQKEIKESQEESNELWSNDYLKVIDAEGWTVVEEKDMVVTIPILMEYNQIVLRLEDVPPFKLKYPAQDKFLTCVSGSMEKGESVKETLFREVKEETGIVIKEETDIEQMQPLFVSKGNTAQYHICILPLYEKDYYEIIPPTDGSESEKKSSNVKIDVKFINQINTNDLITRHVLDLVKKYLKIP